MEPETCPVCKRETRRKIVWENGKNMGEVKVCRCGYQSSLPRKHYPKPLAKGQARL